MVLQESGEHVLITAGEVHLQKCLRDLRESFAKIEINHSQPMVPFRETIIRSPVDDDKTGCVQLTLPNKYLIKLRTKALPKEVVSLLDGNANLIKKMYKSITKPQVSQFQEESLLHTEETEMKKLHDALDSAFESAGWDKVARQILAFGPRHNGPNILLNSSNTTLPNVWDPSKFIERTLLDFSNNAVNGFQLATLAGPLCEEPLMGVCFIIEDLTIAEGVNSEEPDDSETAQVLAGASGQVISMVKDGCRRAFQLHPQRLMAAMYQCSIQVSGDVVGKQTVISLLFFLFSQSNLDLVLVAVFSKLTM